MQHAGLQRKRALTLAARQEAGLKQRIGDRTRRIAFADLHERDPDQLDAGSQAQTRMSQV